MDKSGGAAKDMSARLAIAMRLAAGILADPRADDISIAWIFAKAEAMLAEEARRVEKERTPACDHLVDGCDCGNE